ncbi:MAG: cadmium-translocating P-type ATPase [Cytophagales bacterium]|nr:cadmium-translocating P-type ATPase [Cytophagales bacterium]
MSTQPTTHQHECCAAHSHETQKVSDTKIQVHPWLAPVVSLMLLSTGLLFDSTLAPWFTPSVRLLWYAVAYAPVGIPVLAKAFRLVMSGEVFTEFLLMSLATVGAFYLNEYPEGVAVMLFYTIGELLQDAAVHRARRNIQTLLDLRPANATVLRGNQYIKIPAAQVQPSEILQVKAGDRVALDGELLTAEASFNATALTGESIPKLLTQGQPVLAGMICEQQVAEIKVTRPFDESSMARILTMVQTAVSKKAPTELFLRKFARYYTPAVALLAATIVLVPWVFVKDYHFHEWLYRGLIFLVISCPCALVVAIPLAYFGGLGASSRNGILFKGASYLDKLSQTGTIVFDKTGTLTHGTFVVKNVVSQVATTEWLALAAALQSRSNHPIAKALIKYVQASAPFQVNQPQELKGLGITGIVNQQHVTVGTTRLLSHLGIAFPTQLNDITSTLACVAIDKVFAGYITFADELKADSAATIAQLTRAGINTIILSGDKQAVVNEVAAILQVPTAVGNLLPEDKMQQLQSIKAASVKPVAFVGDGINDAPVLALSDVGIAMGHGTDVAIETADVVIQNSEPSKIITALKISKATQRIVWQNIALALGIKLIVLALGAGGIATLWEAVFADVGVALLAIGNAVRIQHRQIGT